MRILVDIPDQDLKTLNRMSKQREVSRASLVREAVTAYVATEHNKSRDEVRKAAFGIWKDRGIDGLDYQKKIRAEWDDR